MDLIKMVCLTNRIHELDRLPGNICIDGVSARVPWWDISTITQDVSASTSAPCPRNEKYVSPQAIVHASSAIDMNDSEIVT